MRPAPKPIDSIDFFDFLLNSSIFHDFSLRSRGEVSKNAPFSKVGHQLDRSRKYFFSPKDEATRRVFGNQIANERRTYNIYRVATLFWRGTEERDEGKRHFGENILIDLVSTTGTKTLKFTHSAIRSICKILYKKKCLPLQTSPSLLIDTDEKGEVSRSEVQGSVGSGG